MYAEIFWYWTKMIHNFKKDIHFIFISYSFHIGGVSCMENESFHLRKIEVFNGVNGILP